MLLNSKNYISKVTDFDNTRNIYLFENMKPHLRGEKMAVSCEMKKKTKYVQSTTSKPPFFLCDNAGYIYVDSL